jgi:ADP-ribose pyrophosphatase YjhB (NUDIX family)
MLTGTANMFQEIAVGPEGLPRNSELFRSALGPSLEGWGAEGYKLVWLEVPLTHDALIPVAADAGFTFHHSGEGYLMMVRRLEEGASIPLAATHFIGAGGVVINDRQELLVVSERHRPGNRPNYKPPGGALELGEQLVEAVVREVLEETGIQTRFESLVCFRHGHGFRYGKSLIYFVCCLWPLSHEIVLQSGEIEECLWMPVEDYMGSDLVSVSNKRIVQAALAGPGVAPSVAPSEVDGYGDPARHEFFSLTRAD